MASMKTDGNLIVKRKNDIKGCIYLLKIMANTTGLVWIFFGGIILPLVVWTYGEFLRILLRKDV